MNPLLKLVEEKIAEAMQNGEFDNLPGRGQPLDLEEDSHIPLELRMAYRMLKRANVPPEEVLLKRDTTSLRQLLDNENLSEEERRQIKRKIMLLDLELNMKLEQFRRQYGGL